MEEDYDETHQPDDGVGENIHHDHSYATKDKNALNIVQLDMTNDDDLQKSMITEPNDGVGVIDLGYLDRNAAITELAIQYDNLPAIPCASDLAVHQQGHSFAPIQTSQSQSAETPIEEDYDETHQPDDGVGENIYHDHSYATRDKNALNILQLDMTNDDDLQKGLTHALKPLEDHPNSPIMVDRIPTPHSPALVSGSKPPQSVEESEESLARSMKNSKLLLQELREGKIRCRADVAKLSMDRMRKLAPRLVRFLMYQHEGLYTVILILMSKMYCVDYFYQQM